MEAYNEDGEQIEDALSQDEVSAKIDERIAEMTEKGLVLTEEQKEAFDKLKDKDFNFEELRKKAEGKKEEGDEEKETLEARLKAIEESTKSKEEKQTLSWEEKAFVAVNPEGDEKLNEKIKHIIETKLSGVKPRSEQEYLELVGDASKLLPTDEKNPIYQANAVGGQVGSANISYANTAEGKAKARAMGMTYQDEIKK